MHLSHVVRQFKTHPRLLIASVLGVAAGLIRPSDLAWQTHTIIAFDVAGVTFLVLAWNMMIRTKPETLQARAGQQDEEPITILLLTVGATAFSLAAIGVELHGLKVLTAAETLRHVGLAAFTIVCCWLVTHTMFALHYAHGYFGNSGRRTKRAAARGGLAFPGGELPGYGEFLYFSFVVGMTCQTSDVAVESRAMRRLCLMQGVLAFFFNTVILALSVNIAAGLI
jgi:uncharacterized membrane protein